jgi:putative ABC transport system substrate-binding protein
VLALSSETRTIPIVFSDVVDPVTTGLVASLSHPSGNITGFTNFEPSIMGKYVELLKEIAPRITCVAHLRNPATATPGQGAELFRHYREQAAATLGLKMRLTEVHRPVELDTAVAGIAQEPDCGVIVAMSSFFVVHHARVIELMAYHRLPAVYGFRVYPERGGLLSYNVDQPQMSRQVASYVDRILRGEKPSNLPVVQPTKFEIVINLKTAKALGLTIPPTLLARADAVIE